MMTHSLMCNESILKRYLCVNTEQLWRTVYVKSITGCFVTANRMGLVFVCDCLFSFVFRLAKVVFASCRISFTVYNITNLNVKKKKIKSILIKF